MTPLHSTDTTYRNVFFPFFLFFFFVVLHYKLLLLMLLFDVMLRNNLVAFGIVLPRLLVRALSSTDNLAASGNSSLCNFEHLFLLQLNPFRSCYVIEKTVNLSSFTVNICTIHGHIVFICLLPAATIYHLLFMYFTDSPLNVTIFLLDL